MRWLALLLLLVSAPAAAQGGPDAPRLIADVSQSRIDIEYSFAGAELLIFGAIQYPGGRTPEKAPDVVVIVRGPPEPITVRRKEKVLGIWMNVRAVRFETAPGFYAVATSAPSTHLADERTSAIYELGLDHLQLSPASGNAPDEIQEFEAGLIDVRRRGGFYSEVAGGVDIVENVLYRARISIPADVPVGRYAAEVYLVRDGEVLARTSRDISIDKSGFERAVYVAAQDHELGYGLFAVALALLSGWAAGAVVRR
jgi:uncharacterized protein (TIGR02186 family)